MFLNNVNPSTLVIVEDLLLLKTAKIGAAERLLYLKNKIKSQDLVG